MNINIKDLLIRMLFSMIAIVLVSFFTPGIRMYGGIKTALIVGLVVGFLHAFLSDILNISGEATKRGLTAFLVSAVVLYVTGKIIPGFRVTLFGSLIGSIVLGIVQGILPQSKLRG